MIHVHGETSVAIKAGFLPFVLFLCLPPAYFMTAVAIVLVVLIAACAV